LALVVPFFIVLSVFLTLAKFAGTKIELPRSMRQTKPILFVSWFAADVPALMVRTKTPATIPFSLPIFIF
jgi:hypothetical protein